MGRVRGRHRPGRERTRGPGVQPRERVAVLMDNRQETVLALFGIVRAGAVAVPLNISINDAAVAAMCAMPAASPCSPRGITARGSMRCAPRVSSARRHFIGCDAPGGVGTIFRHSSPHSRERAPGGDCAGR